MQISDVAGVWVNGEDMHPASNVWMREWMTKDGKHSGICSQFSFPQFPPDQIMWHYPLVAPKAHEAPPRSFWQRLAGKFATA